MVAHSHPIREIARQAGVSEATVDRVLHGRAGVREGTAAQVRQAIVDLDRQRSQLRLSGRRFMLDLVMETPRRFSDLTRAALEAELPTLRPAVFRARYHVREAWEQEELIAVLDGIARRGSQRIDAYGGWQRATPWLAGSFLIAGLATLSLPGLSTFVSEFLVIAGSWSTQPVATAFAVWGVVLAAIYVLLMYKRIFTGPPPVVVGDAEAEAGADDLAVAARTQEATPAAAELPYVRADLDEGVTPARLSAPLRDLGWREKAVVAPVVVALVVLGFFPKPVLDTLDPAVERTLQIVGVSDRAPSVPADAGSTSGSDH